jgi:mono/diheme cytochrome c family protein
MMTLTRGRIGNLLVALIVLLGAATVVRTSEQSSAQRSGRDQDAASFPDIRDHFKYGSIGAEEGSGIPYWIWRVLPIVFEDKLPKRPGAGYERIGFLSDGAPHGRPIGTSFRPGRGDRVGLNCATCHVGTIRDTPDSPRRVVLGMPANQMDLQGYARFLTACAQDPRFNAGTLIDAIQKENPDFGFFSRLFYRLFVIRATKNGILDRAKANAWFDVRPPFGPGRVDTFNPYKVLRRLPMENDKTVGTVDLPSLWNQKPRQGLWLHWDGNNDLVEERNKSAAIGAGATPDSLDLPSMTRIEEWIWDLEPPVYPATRIDNTKATAGRRVWDADCASCHAFGQPNTGQVTALADIGTDAERVHSFTAALAVEMNKIGEGHPWKFSHFRKTEGYANMPLDGLWLRAPYLHNGSVPDLRALLFPEERPETFYRAYDVYDWNRVGFVSSGVEAERNGIRFDTKERGNGNGGHLYGTKRTREEKEALLEYLKTL